jgi:hypothetical protein
MGLVPSLAAFSQTHEGSMSLIQRHDPQEKIHVHANIQPNSTGF